MNSRRIMMHIIGCDIGNGIEVGLTLS